jgi:beta-glucanase (GH16 family)
MPRSQTLKNLPTPSNLSPHNLPKNLYQLQKTSKIQFFLKSLNTSIPSSRILIDIITQYNKKSVHKITGVERKINMVSTLGVSLMCLLIVGIQSQTLIFDEEFNTLDLSVWKHELTLAGGGNWEFEWYVNNRSNSYVKNGVLYIMPTLSEDAIGLQQVLTGDVNVWGGSPADQCTMNSFYGCERNAAASGNYNNPVRSARIRTADSFSFKYGRVEVRAQLPAGNWLWPAIWMLPRYNAYGNWPVSGEIDIMESRGNDPSYPGGGNNQFGSTLHWGTDWAHNQYQKTHQVYNNAQSLASDFHIYGLYWDQNGLYTYFDTPSNKVLSVDFTQQSFFQRGQFPSNFANPWVGGSNASPFDQEFYFTINLAVGGTNGYFPDGMGAKPWSDNDPHSINSFYNNRGSWIPTWQGEGAALKVDYVKVWSLSAEEEAAAAAKAQTQ